MDMLAGMMGGRAAEELACDDITTGAQNDLKQAAHIARMMVCEWGMSPLLGPQSFGNREELLFLGREVSRTQEYSEETARTIDAEVKRILQQNHDRAVDILKAHREHLDQVAQLLLERETLDGRDVEDIVNHGRILSEVEREEQDEKEKMSQEHVPSEADGAAEADTGEASEQPGTHFSETA
jgi:cell division protease FtsH